MSLIECPDVFLGLPSCLGLELLMQWLSIDDIGKLDSAVCHRKKRAVLMELFHTDKTVFIDSSNKLRTEIFFHWVVLRSIRLS